MPDRSNELKESLEFALASGKMGTWDIDLENNHVICSAEMLRLFGIEPESFNNDRDLLQSKVHFNDRQIMIEAINTAIERRDIYEFEYRIYPSPGEMRWVVSRGRCTYGEESDRPVRFAGIIYDITEKKLKDEALANAVRARDSFFMVAGHELRTPLACLHLQIEVMNWELKNNHSDAFANAKIQQGLKKQQEHLFRVSQIIDNILSEARSSKECEIALQSESVDLQELTEEVLGRIRVAADACSTPISFSRKERVVGFWDRSRIEQIIINLFTNALKYGNKNPVSIEVKKIDKDAVLIVRDQGVGIAPDDHDRIFGQFERVINSQKITGMGLGLYISRKIARSHGGDISVRSNLNEGAEFILKLPLSR